MSVVNITMKETKRDKVREAEFVVTPEQEAFVEQADREWLELLEADEPIPPQFYTKCWMRKTSGIFGMPGIDDFEDDDSIPDYWTPETGPVFLKKK